MTPRSPRQRGLSIPEVIVAVVVGGLVTAAGYKAFLRFSYQSRAQAAIAKAQSELLAVQAAMEKELRRAMFNLPPKTPGLNASGRLDTLYAIVAAENGNAHDAITVRGNFSEAASQIIQALPRGVAQMQLRSGGSRGFGVGDTILLRDSQNTEWCVVTGVSAATDIIRTRRRIHDFPVGTEVIKASSATFRAIGDTLFLFSDSRRKVLTRNLESLEFSALGFDNRWDASPPWDIAHIQSLQYTLRTRVPKPGRRGFLYRDGGGVIHLRNAR